MKLNLRAPDHLGDGVMALPAIAALSKAYSCVVYAPRWGEELYGWLGVEVKSKDQIPEAGVGVLFKPSFGAAWRWRQLEKRVGLAIHGRSLLLSDPVEEPLKHRRLGFAAIAAHLGVEVEESPCYRPRGQSLSLPAGAIALNPWSPSPTVRWPYFRQLAIALSQKGMPVVFFCGPGEEAFVTPIAQGFPLVAGLSLPDFAATLQNCKLFISNDSGAAHFAAACGVWVWMLHGSTSAEKTGVGTPIQGKPLWCQPCYRKSCFWGMPCLTGLSVEQVLGALQ